MKHSKQVDAVVSAWISKVEEKLAAEGIFTDQHKVFDSSLAEWRLPFHQADSTARLLLSVTPVNGKLQVSWDVRFAGMTMGDALIDRRITHSIGLCAVGSLANFVEESLQETRPSQLASWLIAGGEETGKRIQGPHNGCWHTLILPQPPSMSLHYA